MSRCMFCKRETKIFVLSLNESFTSWIFNLLGPVEQYITPKRGICSSCLYLINNLLSVKRCLLHFIAVEDTKENFVTNYEKFIKIYDTLLHNLQTTKFNIEQDELKAINDYHLENNIGSVSNVALRYSNLSPISASSEVSDHNRDPNESDLLLPMYSEPHKVKRQSRSKQRYDTPIIDREIAATFRKRRKKNEHIWTRRKKSLNNRSQSASERERSRSVSIARPASSQSMYQMPTSTSTTYEINMLAREDIISDCFRKFPCIDGCPETFNDLATLTVHKVTHHRMLAKFWCYECHLQKFTSEKDLNIHKLTTHKVVLSHCLLCSEVLPSMLELKYHLLQHKYKSIPCKYCDKTFTTEETCKIHKEECHKNVKDSDVRIKEPIIKTKFNMKPSELPPIVKLKPGEVIFKELMITGSRDRQKKSSTNKRNFNDSKELIITAPTVTNNALERKENRARLEDGDYVVLFNEKKTKYKGGNESTASNVNLQDCNNSELTNDNDVVNFEENMMV